MRHERYHKTPRFTDAKRPSHLSSQSDPSAQRSPPRAQIKFEVSGPDCLRCFPFAISRREFYFGPLITIPSSLLWDKILVLYTCSECSKTQTGVLRRKAIIFHL